MVAAEVLEGTHAMEDALGQGGSVEALGAVAAAGGMATMAADAIRRAALGEILLYPALAVSADVQM